MRQEGFKTSIYFYVPVARDPKANMVQSFERARAVAHEKGYAPFQTAMFDQMSCSIDAKRNIAAQRFLKTECEWMLMVDDDMDFRHNPNAIVELLDAAWETGAKIVAPLMVRRGAPHYVCFNENRGRPDDTAKAARAVSSNTYLDCQGHVGTGCTLFHRSVFETLPQPWFKTAMTEDCRQCLYVEGSVVKPDCPVCNGTGKNPEGLRIQVGEDTYICRAAVDAGFKVVCALGVIVGHIGDMSFTIEDAIRVQYPVDFSRAVLKSHAKLVSDAVEREGLLVPGLDPRKKERSFEGGPSLVVAAR